MRALLLAAGLGTRLRPLTDTIPKCLVPIKGTPLLNIWLTALIKAKIGPLLVNTHYLNEQVESYIANNQYKDRITITYEPSLLGTAGTLIRNIDFFNEEDGILIHADNYCLADLGEFINAHNRRPKKCLMTMMTFRTDKPSECGIVELDDENIVVGFHEKAPDPPSNLANGAVYIFSKELIGLLKGKYHTITDVSTELIPTLIGKIYSYTTPEVFIDIGTIEAYTLANNLAK